MLQGDIDALEQEKVQLTKKLDMLSKKAIHAGIMGSRYTSSEFLWSIGKLNTNPTYSVITKPLFSYVVEL